MASGSEHAALSHDVLLMVLDMTPFEDWYSHEDRRKHLCNLRLVNRLFNAQVRRRLRAVVTDPENAHGLSSELNHAAVWGKAGYVRFLIANGVDANMKTGSWPQPLLTAALRGTAEVVEALLEGGASTEAKHAYAYLRSPIEVAVISRRIAAVGALLNASDQKDIGSALCVAADNGDDKATRVIVNSGVAIPQDGLDQALLIASYRGKKAIVQALLERGASVTRISDDPIIIDPERSLSQCLQAAINGNHAAVAQLLLDHGGGIHIDNPGASLCVRPSSRDG